MSVGAPPRQAAVGEARLSSLRLGIGAADLPEVTDDTVSGSAMINIAATKRDEQRPRR
jgi:hypothetical protein